MVFDEQRQQRPGGDQHEVDRDGHGEQDHHPGHPAHVAQRFGEIAPHVECAGGGSTHWLRHVDHGQRADAERRRQDIHGQHGLHGQRFDHQGAQRRRDDGHRAVQRGVHPLYASQLGSRHHQGRGCVHGGHMEDAAHRAHQHRQVDNPGPRLTGGKHADQGQGRQGDPAVGHEHHRAPVPAVDERARHRAEEDVRQQRDRRCRRQHRRRSVVRVSHHQRKLHQLAAQQRKRLPIHSVKNGRFRTCRLLAPG